jgi:hypothetical protein
MNSPSLKFGTAIPERTGPINLLGKKQADGTFMTVDEISIRDLTRIHKPPNASKFADELVKKKQYGITHKYIKRLIEDELQKNEGGQTS